MPISERLRRTPLALLAAVSLTTCGKPSPQQPQTRVQEFAERQPAAAPKFLCAQNAVPLRRDCTAERRETATGWIITLHHPDGHFRRILAADNGAITAADGAEKAEVTRGDSGVAIAVGGDRYLLPVRR